MENFDWWSFVGYFMIGWGAMKLAQLYLKAKNEVLEEEINQLQKRIEDRFIQVDIEKHGEVFYLFEKKTGNFVAQGTDMEQLKAHCDSRFKNKVIFANDDELKSVGLI